MTITADKVELKEIEKDRRIIQEARKRVSTCIAFDSLAGIDTKLYRRYKVLRSKIAGAKEEAD